MIKLIIFTLPIVVNVVFAEELPNPPVPHNTDAGREEYPNRNTNKQQDASTAPQPPLITIPITSPAVAIEIKQGAATETANHPNDVRIQPEENRMWPPTAAWAAVYVAGVSAIATVIYAIFALGQWKEIRRQANLTKEGTETNRLAIKAAQQSANAATESAKTADFALKSPERAYLTVREWNISGTRQGNQISGTCSFFNFGRTPAWVTTVHSKCCIDKKEPAIASFREAPIVYAGKPLIVHPQEEHRLRIVSSKMETADFEAMQTGRKNFYFFGCIFYRDIFNREWEEPFFVKCNPITKEFSEIYDPRYYKDKKDA